MMNLGKLYNKRFDERIITKRNILWKVLCKDAFQKYIRNDDTVMDIGAGNCEFINNIICRKKIAVDVRKSTKLRADKNVLVLSCSVFRIPKKYFNRVNVVFLSNFLEHLDSKEEVVEVLCLVNKLLKTGGKILIVQPNIKIVKEKYWDFIDHKVALNSKSVSEALNLAGFKIEKVVERFMPYTTVGNLPINELLVDVYLRIPPILRPFAGQSLFVASKEEKADF